MTASEFYQAGKLSEAVEAAIAEVKKKPTDITARYLLAELLCFAGELDRADKQLDAAFQQASEGSMQVSLFRHLLRAEIARQQFYTDGRLPEFLVDVDPATRLRLDASIAIREQQPDEAHQLLQQAEAARAPLKGKCDGVEFDDFRDLDDLLAGIVEVLTSTGKYYWVPLQLIETISFKQPSRPIDLFWRPVHMVVADGPDGEVYMPTIYAGTADHGDDQLKLGRGTDWVGGESEPVRGRGLRMFLVGEEAKTSLQLTDIEFHTGEAN